MQKAILMWLVISLLLVVSSTAALAQCRTAAQAGMGMTEKMQASDPKKTEAGSTEEVKAGDSGQTGMPDNGIVNTVCPVLGGQVDKDTPYTANYNGKRIGFCCAECLEKFEENPQVYLDKLEGEKS